MRRGDLERQASDGSTRGVRGVITPSGKARRVSDGVKNIGFFGEICCSRSIFARVFKVEIIRINYHPVSFPFWIHH